MSTPTRFAASNLITRRTYEATVHPLHGEAVAMGVLDVTEGVYTVWSGLICADSAAAEARFLRTVETTR